MLIKGVATDSLPATLSTPTTIKPMTTYRITFRDSNNKEYTLPIIAETVGQAVDGLELLGYDMVKVTHSFPAQ